MPSFIMHLLIGEKFCEKNKVLDKIMFLNGNFAPDCTSDKTVSHFSNKSNRKTFTDAAINKVDIKKLSKANFNLNNDFERGEFLHIISDYYFYNIYLLREPNYEKYKNMPYGVVSDLLLKEYNIVANLIKTKFPQLHYELVPENWRISDNGEMKIFSENLLWGFVEFCSSLNLDNIYDNIKTYRSITSF